MSSFHYQEPMFLLLVAITALVVLVNGKYLKDMKEDTKYRLPGTAPGLINDVMTSRTKATMIVIPLMAFTNWFFTLDLDTLPDSVYILLSYYQYPLTFVRFYFQFTTFIISLMRHVFIVHNQKVLRFGKAEAKKVFYHSSIWIPMLMTVLHACTLPIPEQGYDIPLETSYKFLEKSYNMTCGDPMGMKDDCAPILSFVHLYVSKEITKTIGIGVQISYAMMCFNIVDGILYYKTFKMIRKSNGREFLRDALSEESRAYRRKTLGVNIKITFLSWVLECLQGVGIMLVWAFGGERSTRISNILITIMVNVITPCTYILNRETTKQIIVLENWFTGVRAIFMRTTEAQSEVDRLQRERQNAAINNRRS